MRKVDNLTTFMCRLSGNLGASTCWNPHGQSRLVMGLIYLLQIDFVRTKHRRPRTCNWPPCSQRSFTFYNQLAKSHQTILTVNCRLPESHGKTCNEIVWSGLLHVPNSMTSCVRKIAYSDCPSVCPHGTTQLPLGGFS